MILVLVSVVRAATPAGHPKEAHGIGQSGRFPIGPRPGRGLTVPEIRRLGHLLLSVVADSEQVLALGRTGAGITRGWPCISTTSGGRSLRYELLLY